MAIKFSDVGAPTHIIMLWEIGHVSTPRLPNAIPVDSAGICHGVNKM